MGSSRQRILRVIDQELAAALACLDLDLALAARQPNLKAARARAVPAGAVIPGPGTGGMGP